MRGIFFFQIFLFIDLIRRDISKGEYDAREKEINLYSIYTYTFIYFLIFADLIYSPISIYHGFPGLLLLLFEMLLIFGSKLFGWKGAGGGKNKGIDGINKGSGGFWKYGNGM